MRRRLISYTRYRINRWAVLRRPRRPTRGRTRRPARRSPATPRGRSGGARGRRSPRRRRPTRGPLGTSAAPQVLQRDNGGDHYRDQSAGPAAPRLPFGGGRLVRLHIRGRSRGPAGPAPGFKGALRSGRRAAWLEPQVHEARVVVVHRHLSPWAALGVKSIGDMGTWKFAAAAHAIARARPPTRPSTSRLG